ncbi:MAG: 3-phosphoshikimate 1-carboxyvinyltransferase [Pseudomonadota bacterium]|nr:3-phosphoshikimate 1-carboxyvinyltransferase [Pseudomonadota bacterium]
MINLEKKFVVQPDGNINGQVSIPGDKSISHRALILSSIAEGETIIRGFLMGQDCLATLIALEQLGVSVDLSKESEIRVSGLGLDGLQPSSKTLDLGNSGTAIRLMTGLLAGQPFKSCLTGDASLRRRPMDRLANPLREMGAIIETNNGTAPIKLQGGNLKGINFESTVASAQLKSALLIAGLFAKGETSIIEPAVTRDHTERMLAAFGVDLGIQDKYICLDGLQGLKATELEVPGDLSSAAFIIAAGIIAGENEIRIDGVGVNPTRTGIIEVLRLMGAEISLLNQRMFNQEPVADLVVKATNLKGINLPNELVSLSIDEFPIIFALAACADGETLITGAEELRYKESDRISIMTKGLHQMGVKAEELNDGVRIKGGELNGAVIDSAGDHRIAMAFAVLALKANNPVEILNTANVDTSFPSFCHLMRSLGVIIEEINL